MATRIYGDGSNSPPDGSWSTGANWTGDTKPGAGDDAVFRGNDADEDTNCTCDENISVTNFEVQSGYAGTVDLGDSSYTHAISGNVVCQGSGTVDAGNADTTVSGNFSLGSGFTWDGDQSYLTFDGTTDFTDDTVAGQYLGVVEVDGTALTLETDLNCGLFTLTSGTFDINGQTLACTGSVQFDGGTFADPVGGTIEGDVFTVDGVDLIGSGAWYLLIAPEPPHLSNITITYCDNSGGGVEGDATVNCVDGGNNYNIYFGEIVGSICWGHVTGVTEDVAEAFSERWYGTGLIYGTSDAERMAVNSGEVMYSGITATGVKDIALTQNGYDGTGDDVTLEWRTGATYMGCFDSPVWTEYSAPFRSLGYIQVKLTPTL